MDQVMVNQHQPPPPQSSGNSLNNFDKIHDDCNLPIILLFVGSKFAPIFIYLLFKFATDQYLSTFILISILLSVDFWITKNLGGRHLAALRWYTKLDEDNHQTWCFQSDQKRVPSIVNTTVFWGAQFIPFLFWISITLINLVTLSTFWIFLAIFCCILLGTNFLFFLECKGDHQKRVNRLTKRFGIQFFELNEEKV